MQTVCHSELGIGRTGAERGSWHKLIPSPAWHCVVVSFQRQHQQQCSTWLREGQGQFRDRGGWFMGQWAYAFKGLGRMGG